MKTESYLLSNRDGFLPVSLSFVEVQTRIILRYLDFYLLFSQVLNQDDIKMSRLPKTTRAPYDRMPEGWGDGIGVWSYRRPIQTCLSLRWITDQVQLAQKVLS